MDALDLFDVCNKGAWLEADTHLSFLFAGIRFTRVVLPAVVLDSPFTHVGDDISDLPPPPKRFKDGIEAARIYACPMRGRVRHVKLLPHAICYVPAQYRHYYIDLTTSFEHYLSKFRSKSRSTLKRKVKKFQDTAGNAQPFREFSRPEDMAEFHRLALSVSNKTYQKVLLNAGIPEAPEFQRELASLAARDRVRGYVLMHSGEPVSFSLCTAADRTLTLAKTGFDRAYERCNPGTVLTYLMLQRLFAERRFGVYDFGSGDFHWKSFFATDDLQCGDLIYLRRTARNTALVYAHCGLNIISDALKDFLDLLGLKAKVRKFIHGIV